MTRKKQEETMDVPLGEMKPEELQNVQLRLAEREIRVMNNLDSIKEPIDATIVLGDQNVRYRNKAYIELFLGMQTNRKRYLLEFIEKTKKLVKKS